MTKEKTSTEAMVEILNAAEESMSVLDQHQAGHTEIAHAFRRAYDAIKVARDREAYAWNYDLQDDEEAIYRCDQASEPYHSTDVNGPCDIWSTGQLCAYHRARKEYLANQQGANGV